MPEKRTFTLCLISANKRCHANSITSSRLLKYFAANGQPLTDDIAAADVILLNACGSMWKTQDFSRKLFRKALKRRRPDARILCVGCLGLIDPGFFRGDPGGVEVIKDNSELDAILGAEVPFASLKEAYYDEALYPRLGRDPVLFAPVLAGIAGLLGRIRPNRGRFLQKVAAVRHENKLHVHIGSGCAYSCSYCAIKLAKGGPASRTVEEVLSDVGKAYAKGAILHLVADDCGSYGLDIGSDLFTLVSSLTRCFPGIPIDIRYVNPAWLVKHPERYLRMFGENAINSVNVCMQSGSARILSLMNRNYRVAEVLEVVEAVKRASPRTLVRSHFITGFPTETWDDFHDTLKAARRFHFHNSYVYSSLKGTRACEMPDDVPFAVNALRRAILQADSAWRFFRD